MAKIKARRRFVVTGGTGFLGRAVVRALLEGGAEPDDLVVISRGSHPELDALGVRHVAGSVNDRRALDRSFDGADVVLHLAGQVSRDPRDAAALFRLHVDGTRTVLAAARGARVRRVVYASTSGTVGCSRDPDHVALDDDPYCDDVAGRWPYYASKIQAEREAIAFTERVGLPVIILNPSLLLGPGDHGGSSTGDVVRFLRRRLPSVPSGGLSVVDVRDAAAAFVAASARGVPGRRHLLGSANLTLAEFFAQLEAVSGVRAPRLKLPGRVEWLSGAAVELGARLLRRETPFDRQSIEMAHCTWYIDPARARASLGFDPRPVEETLRDTVTDLVAAGVVRG